MLAMTEPIKLYRPERAPRPVELPSEKAFFASVRRGVVELRAATSAVLPVLSQLRGSPIIWPDEAAYAVSLLVRVGDTARTLRAAIQAPTAPLATMASRQQALFHLSQVEGVVGRLVADLELASSISAQPAGKAVQGKARIDQALRGLENACEGAVSECERFADVARFQVARFPLLSGRTVDKI